ncbi:MAG: methyltransferase [Spirochaetaceae bacterium]|jgi:23S rRNA (uracil1939-C5)-methyltransferase|nr:methyltransferase [Spirochaetaceae bacterium]
MDCPLFGLCGGCDLWELPYEAQLASKEKTLLELLHNALPGVELPPLGVVPSAHFEYRSRVELHRLSETPPARRVKKLSIRKNKDNSQGCTAGFSAKNSGDIVPINDCPVAVPAIREALRQGLLTPPPESGRWAVLAAQQEDKTILLTEGGAGGFASRAKMRILDRPFIVDAGVFFQSNLLLLEKMIEEVCAAAKNHTGDVVCWDLYCGAGTFSVFLRDIFPRLVLMEANKTALSLARENLEGAGHSDGIQYYALSDTAWVKEMRKRKKQAAPVFVSVDPPRKGLSSEMIDFLCETAPAALVYISCNPRALANNAKTLSSGGFILKTLTFYDFYPQTSHIETLAVFEH